MIHYVSLLRESVIGGLESWLVKDFIKIHNEPNLIPELAGISRELQRDNLDYNRIVAYFNDYKWDELTQLSRPVEDQSGEVILRPVVSGPIVSWTIPEFLHMKSGAITGFFFESDGTFNRHQRYFLDLTKLP